MTAPDLGPCLCEPEGEQHEHSDFEPYACADCDCPRHRGRPWLGIERETAENRAQSPAAPPERPKVTIPANGLDFGRERATQAAKLLDDMLDAHGTTGATAADDPIAVCGLADVLEERWPEGADPYDVLAVAIRRLAARPTTAVNMLAKMRRKVRR